jgi:hypothetical protein
MSKTLIMAGRRNAGSKVMEVQIEKRPNLPSLSEFKVRGWVADRSSGGLQVIGYDVRSRDKRVPIYKWPRIAMKVETIRAINGFAAAQQYARTHGVKPFQWLQVGDDSADEVVDVVIRVVETKVTPGVLP